MAKKVKVKNVKKVLSNVLEKFRDAASSEQFLDAAADLMVKNSKASARQGKNPTSGKAYKRIKSDWHFRRQDMASQNKPLSDFYKPTRKSRLSYSGQLIESTKADIKKGKKPSIKLGVNNPRKPYTGIKGKPLKGSGNVKIEQGQRDQGRSLLGINQKTVDTIKQQFINILRRKTK